MIQILRALALSEDLGLMISTHMVSQLSLTPVPLDTMLFSDLLRHQACKVLHIHTFRQNTHKIKKNKSITIPNN